MRVRQLPLLLVGLAPLSHASGHPGPDFSSGCARATGLWRGASYDYRHPFSETIEPVPDTHLVRELHLADGELDGISEVDSDGATLNVGRAADGCSIFSHGSWSVAPLACDGKRLVRLCLANRDGSRHRLDVRVVDRQLHSCRVAVEGRATPQLASSLLGGHAERELATHDEADWARADDKLLVGSPPAGSDVWASTATEWDLSIASRRAEGEDGSGGAAAVLPVDAVRLPGCCWVAVREEPDRGLWVEGGATFAGESKSIGHAYDADGALRRVAFRKVTLPPRATLRLSCERCTLEAVPAGWARGGDADARGDGGDGSGSSTGVGGGGGGGGGDNGGDGAAPPAYWLYHEPGEPLSACVAEPGAATERPALLLTLLGEAPTPLPAAEATGGSAVPPPPPSPPPAAVLGVGTRLLLEDERVALWEFQLAPGERCPFHTHRRAYAFVNLEASLTQALADDGSDFGKPAFQTQGQVTYVSPEHLGSHGVRNVGDQPFVQFVLEFKDRAVS